MREFYVHAGRPPMTLEEAELLISGQAIARGGGPGGPVLPHQLHGDRLREFEKAQDRGWIRGTEPALRNAWWVWCEATNHPFVTVRPTGRLAEVEMDLREFCGGHPFPGLQDQVRALCEPHSRRRRCFYGRFTQVTVSLLQADEVAEALVDLAQALARQVPEDEWRRRTGR